ncbi:MAG: TPMT family class I SAM-dependent methyltransferase [Bacteroidia bacterium]|nr:TPMT family class I SAM-dependent methyltransferase [Bacteroidia bacterium]
MKGVQKAEYWEGRYERGEVGWDLKGPTPVLKRLLASDLFPVLPPARVLVPGCGYGHDVLLLAEAGYRPIGVDFATRPLDVLCASAEERGLLHRIALYREDFFALSSANLSVDAVWEYTCFCAINPSQRDAYFRQMRHLLRTGGWLVGLFFPLEAVHSACGEPPFPVSREEVIDLAAQSGFVLHHEEWPEDSHPARKGRELLLFFTVEG